MSAEDEAAIAARINDWVIFRDSGNWDRFSALWAPGGKMNATWFSGSADDFIARSRAGFKGPIPAVLHVLGGISVDVRDDRAVSQAKMTIGARAIVHGAPCRTACSGRFYDRAQKSGERFPACWSDYRSTSATASIRSAARGIRCWMPAFSPRSRPATSISVTRSKPAARP